MLVPQKVAARTAERQDANRAVDALRRPNIIAFP
jgi:hypothetical protein